MTLSEMLESLGFDPDNLLTGADSQELEDLLYETEIKIHQQPSWPLKSGLDNACLLDGEITLAAGNAGEYGSKEAWEER